VITSAKDFLKRHWPALRLRTIVLVVLLFAAAMPAIEAVWLRGYETTLVRQTEAELVVQGAALAATAADLWPGSSPRTGGQGVGGAPPRRPEQSQIDLGSTPVLPDRPLPAPTRAAPDPEALALAARMGPILADTTRDTLATIVLLDRHGLVVRGPRLGGDLSGLPEVREALSGRETTALRRNGGYHPRHSLEWLSRASDLRVHHARPIFADGHVIGVILLSRSPRALFRDAYQGLWKIALGAVAIIFLLVALSGLVSRGVTRPVEALSTATHQVAAGRGVIPETPPTAAVEIRALYEDFRSMAEAINRRSRYVRDFAAAVSHEFKTPLAGIGGAVELLQDHFETMSAQDRDRFLGNIAADTERLSQLVARLLDLARADMTQPEADATCEVARPAMRIADALTNPDFEVRLDLPGGLPDVAAPETTIQAVLWTLLENSRQAKARVAIVAARVEASGVTLSVGDDGPGVPPQDRDRLFEPFFTTRRAAGGTGLGLPIARSLIEGHGGRLAIADSDAGARFDLWLPISAVGASRP
jgi:signal transduction histidine kinase